MEGFFLRKITLLNFSLTKISLMGVRIPRSGNEWYLDLVR
jgi:hypothetical protein